MRGFLRLAGLTGAVLVLAFLIAIPVPASAGSDRYTDHDQYNGIIPLSEIYEKLGVSYPGRHGCPNPEDFEPLLKLEVNFVEASTETGLPAFYQVTGVIFPEIKFDLRLPPEGEWNNKFYMTGCGGFCGGVDIFPVGQFTNNLNWGLVRGYASATSDSGHDNLGNGRTYADWALDNRPGEIEWGFLSIHEVTRVSKALICAFYGQRPRYSYFAGCSTGGRMAVVEANRYPEDFDGVISGAPALNYTGLVATWMSWVVQAVGDNVFTEDEQNTIREFVLAECSSNTGAVENGLIIDPRLCPEIDFSGIGLSDAQVAALNQLHSKPENSAGDVLYDGVLPYGSEFYWPIWLPGATTNGVYPQLNLIAPFNGGFLKYMAFEVDDPEFTAFDFNFDEDPPMLAYMGRMYNATTNLDAFKKAGGKILMYHGWADSIVPPIYSQHFYDLVANAMGGVKKTQKFFRLFMIPGMDHCSTAVAFGKSIGLDDFDALTALENWVERGQAPDSMDASGDTLDGDPISQVLYPYRSDEFPGQGKRGRWHGGHWD